MFHLFVYVVAVLFVLVLVADRPTVVQSAPELEPEFEPWVEEMVRDALGDEDSAVFELADRLELIAIKPAVQPIDWDSLNDRQLRALCQLHEIPCSKRGRVSRGVIAQLQAA